VAVARTGAVVTLTLTLAPLLLLACRIAPAEEVLLRRFFEVSRVRDRTLLANIATVVFEPARDGIVQSFELTGTQTSGSTKRITLDAQVRSLDGTTITKPLTATMEYIDGRWIVTGVN
jgi:hypothetical protein